MTDNNLFSCANPECTKEGKLACTNCHLVSYCEKKCQKAHWPKHKKDCESPMIKPDWRPDWENVPPAFVTSKLANHLLSSNQDRWLWGNVPAVDVLKLKENEGESYSEDIALLFAASGDLRNVMKTISHLPDSFTKQLEVTMNDREFHVVARNAIFLLFILTMLEDTNALTGGFNDADSLIHLWYSVLLPHRTVSELALRVLPLIREACRTASEKKTGEIFEKTWVFSHGKSLHLSLKKEDWVRMRALCHVPQHLTKVKASAIRTATMMSEERRDFRDRWAFKEPNGSTRLAKQKFREDGLLLPFAHNRAGFDVPNPTFFLRSFAWPIKDTVDPIDGWPLFEVHRVKTLAKEDLYAKLYIYLQHVFRKFFKRLRTVNVTFQLLNIDALDLPGVLQENKYTRIEVSNITDNGYLGTHATLGAVSKLLQTPHKNPHATIIAGHLNAVFEMLSLDNNMGRVPNAEALSKYFPHMSMLSSLEPGIADSLRIWDAWKLAFERDKFFERYLRHENFAQIGNDFDVEMKTSNTVTEAWPTIPTLKPGQNGAQAQFDILLGSHYNCLERFVEWRRTK